MFHDSDNKSLKARGRMPMNVRDTAKPCHGILRGLNYTFGN